MRILSLLNLVSLISCAAFLIVGQSFPILDIAVGLWMLVMLLNLTLPLYQTRMSLRGFLILIEPVIVMFMVLFSGSSQNSLYLHIAAGVLACLHFLSSMRLSAVLALASPWEDRKPWPSALGLILFPLLWLTVFGIAAFYLGMTLIPAEVPLGEWIPELQDYRMVMPFLLTATAVILSRHLRIRRMNYLARSVMRLSWMAVLLFTLPLFSLPLLQDALTREYNLGMGTQAPKARLHLSDAVLGTRPSECVLLEDQSYKIHSVKDAEGKILLTQPLEFDLYTPAESASAHPVVVMIHDSGSRKGPGNLPLLSQRLAQEGFAVVDIDYGNEIIRPGNDLLVENILDLMDHLCQNSGLLKLDMDHVFLFGRGKGGEMALKTLASWSQDTAGGLERKLTIRGAVLLWSIQSDVFKKAGRERVISLDEVSGGFPGILLIAAERGGSMEGSQMLSGVLLARGVPSATLTLPYCWDGADRLQASYPSQAITLMSLQFLRDMMDFEPRRPKASLQEWSQDTPSMGMTVR